MMAKTPSLNASIREVGISPTLKSVCDGLCRLIFLAGPRRGLARP
jgi:hypothetical protein